jgi:hypothetical protein
MRKLAISRQISAIRLSVFLSFCLFAFLFPITSALNPSQAVVGEIGIKQPETNAGVKVTTQSGAQLLGIIIQNFLTLIYAVASIGVLIMFVWGATEWILSGGDKEKIAAARKRIVNALIGLVLLALTFVILGVMSQITGINLLGDIRLPKLGSQ